MKRRTWDAVAMAGMVVCVLGAAIAVVCGYSRAAESIPKTIQLVAEHPLTISEPSDLTIDGSGTTLWTVTNKPARVYQLDLSGNVVKMLRYEGEDLEGVVHDPSDGSLWVVEERTRVLVHLDREGVVIAKHQLDLTGKKNSGPEGICLDSRGRMFLVNEKNPGLFIEMSKARTISSKSPLGFAEDYSGIAFDRKRGIFWIVSDESQKLYLWSKQRGIVGEYALPFTKAEGVAVNETGNLIYIVSDSENKLYVYRI